MELKGVKARMQMWLVGNSRVSTQKGFTYVLMLMVVAVVSIIAGITSQTMSLKMQREKENELLFRGNQYYQAIRSYYLSDGGKQYPRRLEDLLQDPRYIDKKHLRKLYKDPYANKNQSEWTIILAPEGGVMGVASKNVNKPIKQIEFPKHLSSFENSQSYTDWRFVYLGEIEPLTSPR